MRFLVSSLNFALIGVIGFMTPLYAFAAANAGFIDKPIWFSNKPDTAGETTIISTLINNQDPRAFYGLVGFYDNGLLLARKATTVEANASKVVSVNWKVTSGDHSIVAKLENTRLESAEGDEVEVENNQTEPYKFSVAAPTSSTSQASQTESQVTGNAGSDPNKSDLENTVDEAKAAATTTFNSFDNFRQETADTYAQKAQKQSEAIAEAKSEKSEGQVAGASATKESDKVKESFLKTPFEYVKLYFFKLVNFIFSHKYVFYGLIILIIILLGRYVIRAPR